MKPRKHLARAALRVTGILNENLEKSRRAMLAASVILNANLLKHRKMQTYGSTAWHDGTMVARRRHNGTRWHTSRRHDNGTTAADEVGGMRTRHETAARQPGRLSTARQQHEGTTASLQPANSPHMLVIPKGLSVYVRAVYRVRLAKSHSLLNPIKPTCSVQRLTQSVYTGKTQQRTTA